MPNEDEKSVVLDWWLEFTHGIRLIEDSRYIKVFTWDIGWREWDQRIIKEFIAEVNIDNYQCDG